MSCLLLLTRPLNYIVAQTLVANGGLEVTGSLSLCDYVVGISQ